MAFETRSSAQGNCSAKSLAPPVMSLILPYPTCLLHRGGGGSAGGSSGGGGLVGGGVREGGWGEGAGDILSTLPYTAQPHGASP